MCVTSIELFKVLAKKNDVGNSTEKPIISPQTFPAASTDDEAFLAAAAEAERLRLLAEEQRRLHGLKEAEDVNLVENWRRQEGKRGKITERDFGAV